LSYIHLLEDWPEFRWNREHLEGRLGAVRNLQVRLVGRMSGLGFQLRSQATLQSLTAEVMKSSEIEGEVLDETQVRSPLA
jgi:Fic family protein